MNQLATIKNDDIPLFTLNGITTFGKVVEMYDGDTCKIILLVNNVLQKFSCRLLGLDTLGKVNLIIKLCFIIKCRRDETIIKVCLVKLCFTSDLVQAENRDIEILNAHKCRNRLLQLITNCQCSIDTIMKKQDCIKLLDTNTKIITVQCHEFDKYGRLLVNLYPDELTTDCVN